MLLFVAADARAALQRLAQAEEALRRGNYDEAQKALTLMDPEGFSERDRPRYFAVAGVLAQEAGKVSRALEYHDKATALALELGLPKSVGYAANLAVAAYRLRSPHEAASAKGRLTQAFNLLDTSSPDQVAAGFVIASVLAYLGSPQHAPWAYRLLEELTQRLERDKSAPEPLIVGWGFLALAEHHLRAPRTYDDLALASRWAGVAAESASGRSPAMEAAAAEVRTLATLEEGRSPLSPEAFRALYKDVGEVIKEAAALIAKEKLREEERERALTRLWGEQVQGNA